ncbi:MAG: tetratricopeptide repeat protein [Planctomycetes bacterium]|nr:tetratricopeptide repeat protein [Planctomycetota bacterium]
MKPHTRRPPDSKANKRSPLRLLVLLGIFIFLATYAWRNFEYSRGIAKVEGLLRSEENHTAIAQVEKLHARFGDQLRLRLLLAQAYRQSDQKGPFLRQLELGQVLGLDAETIQGEKLLFEAQSGTMPDAESQISRWMQDNVLAFDAAARSLVFGMLRKQDFESANRFLALWEQQFPDSPWIPTFRGMQYIARRDWKNALAELEPALKKHPDFVPLYLYSGQAYQGDQQFEKAAKQFERYLSSDPENLYGWLNYSEVLRKLGRTDESLEKLQPLLHSKKLPITLQLQIAKLYLDVQTPQKAIDILSKVAVTWPEDVEIASTLSQAYQRLGNEKLSEKYAQIADEGQKQTIDADRMLFELMSNPNRTPQQCYELGHLLLHKKSRENGLHWLEAAIKLDDRFVPAHRDMALYYERINEPQRAAVHRRFIPTEQP